VWYVLSSEESLPPIATFDAQNQENSADVGMSEQLQQQVQSQFDTAAQELRFGEFEQGKAQLLDLIETYPESAYAENAYILLADTYRQRQNNPDEAIKYYQIFAEKFPESPQFGLTQLKMGFSYEDMEDTPSAKAIYQLLIKRNGEKSRLGQLAHERLSNLEGK
jgi:TolA-binding protein